MRRALVLIAALIFSVAASAQTPNLNILRMNSGYAPAPAYYCDYTLGAFCGGEAVSTTSLRTTTDVTGAITSAPNNALLNSASLTTQSVTTKIPWNYLLSFYGTGSVTLSGTATGLLNGTGASNQVYLKVTPTAGTLTLTVVGTVTNAVLAAITYETSPRLTDQVATTSLAYFGPVFAYDLVTHAALGLRVEEGRINLFKNSGAPATQTITVTSGSAYTVTFYGTGTLTLSGALTQTMTGSAYPARTTYTGTTSTTSLVATVTTLGTMSYPQVELGAFATSPVPTGASNVNRSVDLVTIVGQALGVFQGSAFSVVAEVSQVQDYAAYCRIIGTNSTTAPLYVGPNSNQVTSYNGVGSYSVIATGGNGVDFSAGPTRAASSNSPAGRFVAASGMIAAGGHPLASPAAAYIGSNNQTSAFLDGYISKLALYNVALPPAVLQRDTLLKTLLH